jgi:hypothetical protein
MSRPSLQSTFPEPAVTREATTADFQSQETALSAYEQQARETFRPSTSPQTTSPTPSPAPLAMPLFGSTSDLIRSLILQEALGPPLSRRQQRSDSDHS